MSDKSTTAGSVLFDILLPTPETQALSEARRTRQAMEQLATQQREELERQRHEAAWASSAVDGVREALQWRLEKAEARAENLQRQVLTLGLYCRTLLQVLVDNEVITVEGFSKRMTDVDMADGVLDGR